MFDVVTIGGREYALDQGKNVLLGYAFSRSPAQFDAAQRTAFGEPPALQLHRWAYHSYDCISPSPGDFTEIDFLVASGLNGQLSAEPIMAMRSIAGELSHA